MARGKRSSYEDKIAKLTQTIEEVSDKKANAIKKYDEQLKQLNEEKKQLLIEANAARLDGLVGLMNKKGLSVDQLEEMVQSVPDKAE